MLDIDIINMILDIRIDLRSMANIKSRSLSILITINNLFCKNSRKLLYFK